MHHDHDADTARAQTPRVLPHERLGAFGTIRVLDDDVEHLAKVLSETMGRCSLDTTTRGGHKSLYSRSIQTAGELLLLGLDAGDDGHGEQVLVDLAVVLEDLEHLLVGLGLGQVCGVALLPEELAGTEEGLRVLELPPDDGVPLVQLQWKVTVAVNPFCVV